MEILGIVEEVYFSILISRSMNLNLETFQVNPPKESMNSSNSEVKKSGHMSNLSRCTCGGAQDRDRPEEMTVMTAVTFLEKGQIKRVNIVDQRGREGVIQHNLNNRTHHSENNNVHIDT